MSSCCSCGGFATSSSLRTIQNYSSFPGRGGTGGVRNVFFLLLRCRRPPSAAIRASAVDSHESSSSDFAKRMEQAWLISQQPGPVVCSSCNSKGYVECQWCRGTGFFVLGDNILCEVPSRNTSCVICAGKGSTCCSDCKGTGFRAKWLGEPPPSSSP